MTWPAHTAARGRGATEGHTPNSCEVGSHPVTYFPHAECFKNKKVTATHLTSAKPSATQVCCDFQSIADQLQNWSLLLGDQAPAHTGHYMALPFPLSPARRPSPTHRTAETSLQCCGSASQGALSLAGRWQVELGWLFEGDFACVIYCSVLPTAKTQHTEAAGFRIWVHAEMH